jgi:Cu(I)/Ag(I) efflux system membrane fusion protein
VDAVVAAYLDLSGALGAVQKGGRTPVELSAMIGAARTLQGDLRGAKEEPLVAGVAAAAEGMNGQPIERQREAFKTLSTRLIALADMLPPTRAVAERLFVLHCPMAPGDWLQKSDAVANPYYADSMKQCGSVVRTISAQEGKP